MSAAAGEKSPSTEPPPVDLKQSIIKCLEWNDINRLTALLAEKRGELMKKRDADGRHLLHWLVAGNGEGVSASTRETRERAMRAALHGFDELRFLKDEGGWTALMAAIAHQDEGCVEALLVGETEDTFAEHCAARTNDSPLHLAASKGNVAILQQLLRVYGSRKENVEWRNKSGHTCLVRAVSASKTDVVRYLLGSTEQRHDEEDAEEEASGGLILVNPYVKLPDTGENILHIAVGNSDEAIVATILATCPDLADQPDKRGKTPRDGVK